MTRTHHTAVHNLTTIHDMAWWTPYQRSVRFLDGGRHGDLLDCYGLCTRIYRDQLGLTLNPWPEMSLAQVTHDEEGLFRDDFKHPFRPVEQGFEQAFDLAVIRRALPVNGVARRGWWHLGVVSREGHLVHIDYHQGVLEVAFRDSAQARESGALRATDVRLFRHVSLAAPAIGQEACA